MSSTRSPTQRGARIVGVLVPLVLALISAAAAWRVYAEAGQEDRQRFERLADHAASVIEERLSDLSDAAWSGRGHSQASHSVDREAWRVYVNALNLDGRSAGLSSR
ncbi:MAG: hypothetical protein EXR76_06660 [Myxococcales bacterium]|nr:hypothetical protein [Myxococcales bacterium]